MKIVTLHKVFSYLKHSFMFESSRWNATHRKNPHEYFYPDWLLGVVCGKAMKDFNNANLEIRKYVFHMMEKMKSQIDPDNPTCFLQHYMATR